MLRKLLIATTFVLVGTFVVRAQTPPPAQLPIIIALTKEEIDALVELMDAGVKARGIVASGAAAHLLGKIQEAVQRHQKAAQTPPEPPKAEPKGKK